MIKLVLSPVAGIGGEALVEYKYMNCNFPLALCGGREHVMLHASFFSASLLFPLCYVAVNDSAEELGYNF